MKSAETRQIFALREQGFSYTEIAQRMSMTRSKVVSRIQYWRGRALPETPRSKRYTDEEFTAAVAANKSIRATLRSLGLSATGAAYETFRRNVARLELDTSHFTGRGWNQSRGLENREYVPVSEYLGTGRSITSFRLKKKLLQEGYLQDQCVSCGISPEWNGQPLVLQLDHINGDKYDNRLENLRILCPNCHAQQSTSSSKARYSHT